jgi:hypothetical protein
MNVTQARAARYHNFSLAEHVNQAKTSSFQQPARFEGEWVIAVIEGGG